MRTVSKLFIYNVLQNHQAIGFKVGLKWWCFCPVSCHGTSDLLSLTAGWVNKEHISVHMVAVVQTLWTYPLGINQLLDAL